MAEVFLNNFVKAGFEPKEADVYLAVLQLGKATVSDIARKSKIKRTTVYEYIDKLTSENLLHKTVKGKRIFYIAENPNHLSKLLENRKKKIIEIIPKLEDIYHAASHKPQIRFYEGIEGIREVYREMTKTSQIVYGVFSVDKYYTVFNDKDNEEFFKNIRESGGQIKDLIENSPLGKKHVKGHWYKEIGTPKMLPKDFNLAVDLMVVGDKVAMISLVNLIGVVVENREIADLQRNFIKFMRRNIK